MLNFTLFFHWVSSPGLAVETDAGALHRDRVVAGLVVKDVRGLHNLQISVYSVYSVQANITWSALSYRLVRAGLCVVKILDSDWSKYWLWLANRLASDWLRVIKWPGG